MSLTNEGNLFWGDDVQEFFVWVDPHGRMIRHNLGLVGTFTGGPLQLGDDQPARLPFVPNSEEHPIMMTPFHSGLISWYIMDYNLETQRHHRYAQYPSRFYALYLLSSREDANRYQETHPSHVAGRILKRCETRGAYRYSIHDSSWIEFLRTGASSSDETINNIADAYWMGESVEGQQLRAFGEDWSRPSSREVLFYGRVDFPNKDLSTGD